MSTTKNFLKFLYKNNPLSQSRFQESFYSRSFTVAAFNNANNELISGKRINRIASCARTGQSCLNSKVTEFGGEKYLEKTLLNCYSFYHVVVYGD